MNDYRGKLCLLDGEYIAKCIIQDFLSQELTFEVSPGGETFTRQGEGGVEVHNEGTGKLSFDDVKHKLPKIKKEDDEL